MGNWQVKLAWFVHTVGLRHQATSLCANEAAPLQRCSYTVHLCTFCIAGAS